MTQSRTLARCATAALLAAVAFPLAPLAAQETVPPAVPPTATPAPTSPTVVVPPPIVTPQSTVPGTTPPLVTPPIVTPRATVPTPTPTPTRVIPPPVEAADTPDTEAEEPAAAPATRRTSRPSADAGPSRAAPVPVEAEAPAPPATTEIAPIVTEVLPPAAQPAPAPVEPAETAIEGPALWPLVVGALLIAGLGLFAWRRRRSRAAEIYYEEDHVVPVEETIAPTPIAAERPVAADPVLFSAGPAVMTGAAAAHHAREAEPVSSADVSVGEPDAAEVEALVAASTPVADRPWLEFALTPVRAGTTAEDAVVEFELTVGNSGAVSAEDVRISTWMFAAGSAQESEMEKLLIEPPANSTVTEATIEPGEGAHVEATVSLPKSGIVGGDGASFVPVIVADVRYRLPGGGEGHTSASFAVGVPRGSGDGLEPLSTTAPAAMRENIEARLAHLHRDIEAV